MTSLPIFTKTLPASLAQRVTRQLVICGLLSLAAGTAFGADSLSNAKATYLKDRQDCLQGRTNQDQATCLKEAGAAYEEAKRGHLNDDSAQYERNALLRCQALKDDDRTACERRMHGEGTVTGSAESGGVFRTLTTPVPAQDHN